jgi:hypothetical protein
MSRTKIHRLQAGKGVKKNGMYIHDLAASFESLPPGPDPKSVAKDLHQYLPKLTQRKTFFGASQATVNQRHKEFSAFIKALFDENVPSLIKELREDSVIRDFFGYWRRDCDLAVKNGGRRPKTAPFDSVRDISFFSTSGVSLSTPRADLPSISPRSSSSSRRSHRTDSTLSLPDADSVLSAAPKLPSSAPARLSSTPRDSVTSDDEDPSVGRKMSTSFSSPYGSSPPSSPSSHKSATTSRRTLSNRSKNSPSPRNETFNVTSDFPLFLSSSTRDLLPTPQPPHSPSYATQGLGTLPEDSVPVLDSSVSNTPPLTLRGRTHSPLNTKRANRNVVIVPDTDEVSSSEGDNLERELLTPVDGGDFNAFVGRSTSCSSPPPSSALSDLSLQSDGSSWRTSSERTWPSSASSNDSESGIEIDFPHMTCPDSFAQLEGSLSSPTASSSFSTSRDSLYGRRRRSLSQPLPVGSSIPIDVGEEEGWSDQGEDLMEAYLGGSQSIFAPNVRDSLSNYDDVPSDFPDDALDSSSVISFSASRERIPSIYMPPRATLHRPRPSGTTSLNRPPSSQPSRTMSISSSRSAARDDMLVVKAVLDDTKVVLRVQCDVPLTELRRRVLEKLAQTGGLLLRGKFELSYLSPVIGGAGKNRTSTVSSMSTTSLASAVDWTSALPLRNESDWATAIACCGSKITLRVAYPTPQ